jgi:hypothetical protein
LQVILQEKQTSVDVDADEGHKLEVKKFGLEVEQERTALEDAAKDVTEAVLHQLVRVLDGLDHVVVDLGVPEQRWLKLMRGDVD